MYTIYSVPVTSPAPVFQILLNKNPQPLRRFQPHGHLSCRHDDKPRSTAGLASNGLRPGFPQRMRGSRPSIRGACTEETSLPNEPNLVQPVTPNFKNAFPKRTQFCGLPSEFDVSVCGWSLDIEVSHDLSPPPSFGFRVSFELRISNFEFCPFPFLRGASFFARDRKSVV